jgi:hypothetical protein
MSKLQTLGPTARYAGEGRNINAQTGFIADVTNYPEISKVSPQVSAKYQTLFRNGLFSLYNPQQQTVDNFIVNMALEGGYATPMYRTLARLFTLTSLNLAVKLNRDLAAPILEMIARLTLCANPLIRNELMPLATDPSHAAWFQRYNQLANSPDGLAIAEQIKGWMANTGTDFVGSTGGNQQGFGSSTNQNRPSNNLGLDDPTSGLGNVSVTQPSQSQHQSQVTGMGWDDGGMVKDTQVKASVNNTKTGTRNGVVILGGDIQNHAYHLEPAKQVPGGWPTVTGNGTLLTSEDVVSLTPTEWVLWGDGGDINHRTVSPNGVSYENVLESIKELSVSIFGNSKKVPHISRKKKFVSKMLDLQLSAFNNRDNYVCDLDDKPWGLPSIMELIESELPKSLVNSIPDEYNSNVVICGRVYPIFNIAHANTLKLGKFLGADLVAANNNNIWYILIPLITEDGQVLKMFNLIKGNMMDLADYRAPVKNVPLEPIVTTDDKKKVIEQEVYNYPVPITGSVNACVDVMRVMSNRFGPVIGRVVKASFLTLPDEIDRITYATLRSEYVSGKLKSFKDLTLSIKAKLAAVECTNYFADTMDARSQDVVMSMLNDSFGLAISLDASWRDEIEELHDLMFDRGALLNLEQVSILTESQSNFLQTLFEETTNEETLRLAGRIYQTATGVETRMAHSKLIARYASVDPERKLTLQLGDGIIPLIREETLIGVEETSMVLNPSNANSFSGYKLPTVLIKALNDITGIVCLVTKDGVQYAVESTGSDELDAPILIKL